MRGPPPRGLPPPNWPDNRPPDVNHEAVIDWNQEPKKETEGEMNPHNMGESPDRPGEERDFAQRPRRELGDRGEPDRPREQNWERGRDRDDRARIRDRDDRFRDRGRDRERDRGRERDWDRDDGQRVRDFRSSRDFTSDRDVHRGGPRRRSRFEPLEERPVIGEPVLKENNMNEQELQPSRDTSKVAQNSGNEPTSQEEGEIVEGTVKESQNIVMDNAAVNTAKDCDKLNIASEAIDLPQDQKTICIPKDNLDISKHNEATDISMEDNKLLSAQSAVDDATVLLNQGTRDHGETTHSTS